MLRACLISFTFSAWYKTRLSRTYICVPFFPTQPRSLVARCAHENRERSSPLFYILRRWQVVKLQQTRNGCI